MSEIYNGGARGEEAAADLIHEKKEVHVPEELSDPWELEKLRASMHARIPQIPGLPDSDGSAEHRQALLHARGRHRTTALLTRLLGIAVVLLLAFFIGKVVIDWSRLVSQEKVNLVKGPTTDAAMQFPVLTHWPWTSAQSGQALAPLGEDALGARNAMVRASDLLARYELTKGSLQRQEAFREAAVAALVADAAVKRFQDAYRRALAQGVVPRCATDESTIPFDLLEINGLENALEFAVANNVEKNRSQTVADLRRISMNTWRSITSAMQCIDHAHS